MKRRLFKLSLFVLLVLSAGAIINIAIAWWIAGFDDRQWSIAQQIQFLARGGYIAMDSNADVLVTAQVQSRRGAERVIINTWQADHPKRRRPEFKSAGVLPRWVKPGSPSQFTNVRWENIRYADGYGLPFRSMSCAWGNDRSVIDGIGVDPRPVPAATNVAGQLAAASQVSASPPGLPATTTTSDASAQPFVPISFRPPRSPSRIFFTGSRFETEEAADDSSVPLVFVWPPRPESAQQAMMYARWQAQMRAAAQAAAVAATQAAERALPLRPIWTGFALNTGLYALLATVIWAVLICPWRMRRIIRRRRGLCLACGYPIGTNDVCTECGAQLPLPLGEGRGEGSPEVNEQA